MGLTDFPYHLWQEVTWVKETEMLESKDKANPFSWNLLALNLTGSTWHDLQSPWV